MRVREPEQTPADQARIVEALRDQAAYPQRPGAVEVLETHISWVFLVGDRAYKLKKAIRLPFLDYATAARRRFMCEEEVRLNRRLAPSLYLGVRGVVRRGDGLGLGAPGDPAAVDHVVEMRRFAERDTLACRLERGRPCEPELAELAHVVARFHARGRIVRDPAAASERVAASLSETFETLATLDGAALSNAGLSAARRFADAFLTAERPLLERRLREGRIREGHGDLRLDHVLMIGERLEVIDCVEFSLRLRELDVAADLAFPVMELESRGRRADAERLVEAYRDAGGHPGPARLIFFNAAERAWMRAKVALVRAGQLEPAQREAQIEGARSLFELGRRLAWRARPRYAVVVCGPPASGKSTLARALSDAGGLPVVSSDRTRKALAGVPATSPAPPAAYEPDRSAETYRRLGELAERHLREGSSVIVDATYRHASDRRELRARLDSLGVPVLFVECIAAMEVRLERAARRTTAPSISDADARVASRLAAEFEPLDDLPSAIHARVRTDLPAATAVTAVEAALDERWRSSGAPRVPPE
jgi:uncharacterized protein